MTITGSNADHRIRLRPSAMGALAQALRQAVDGNGAALRELAATHRLDARLLAALAKDLGAHRGRAAVRDDHRGFRGPRHSDRADRGA